MLSHYIISRNDLASGLQFAYTVHAAGESSPGNLPEGTRVVSLLAENEDHLRALEKELKAEEVGHKAVWEDGQLYSIGINPTSDLTSVRKVTSRLPLSGQSKAYCVDCSHKIFPRPSTIFSRFFGLCRRLIGSPT